MQNEEFKLLLKQKQLMGIKTKKLYKTRKVKIEGFRLEETFSKG